MTQAPLPRNRQAGTGSPAVLAVATLVIFVSPRARVNQEREVLRKAPRPATG
jgi:hypothetical protein